MDESAVVGQEIGDVSNRWSFEPWDEKFDDLTAEDDGCISDGVSANEVINEALVMCDCVLNNTAEMLIAFCHLSAGLCVADLLDLRGGVGIRMNLINLIC